MLESREKKYDFERIFAHKATSPRKAAKGPRDDPNAWMEAKLAYASAILKYVESS